jgi:hypothetical protein
MSTAGVRLWCDVTDCAGQTGATTDHFELHPRQQAISASEGDRMTWLFLLRCMSPFGTKRTLGLSPNMSAFGGKADIQLTSENARYQNQIQQPAAITSLGQNWNRGFSSG